MPLADSGWRFRSQGVLADTPAQGSRAKGQQGAAVAGAGTAEGEAGGLRCLRSKAFLGQEWRGLVVTPREGGPPVTKHHPQEGA